MRTLTTAALTAALILTPTAAVAGGSDSPTPYTVTAEGITLPAGQTFLDGGHVNVRTTAGDRGIHFEALNNQPSGAWIGASFLPWSAFGLTGDFCVSWVQVAEFNEHHGEGGQDAVCTNPPVVTPGPTSEPTPDPTPTPTPEPTEEPTWEPTAPPTEEPSPEPVDPEQKPNDEPTLVPPGTPTSSGSEASLQRSATPEPTSTSTAATTPSTTTAPSSTTTPRPELAETGWDAGYLLLLISAAFVVAGTFAVRAPRKKNP